jgi:ribonuclease PH
MHQAVEALVASGKLKEVPIRSYVAAVSVGIVGAVPMLDLNYVEDSSADVDFNLVMTDRDEFVEIQGTAERQPFAANVLNALLGLGRQGIHELIEVQRRTIGK